MEHHSKIAFIDAYGNTDLDISKTNASSYFIVTAVIVKKEDIEFFHRKIESVRKKYFQKGPIKSNKVANHKRRMLILQELAKVKFKYISIIVDKSKLKTKGYPFPKSFIKNLHLPLHKHLINTFDNLLIEQDTFGSKNFMKGYNNYLSTKFPVDLFNSAKFMFGKSDESLGIQVADFISGSLSKYYDPKKKIEQGGDYLRVLKNNLLFVEELPFSKESLLSNFHKNSVNYDKTIAEASIRLVDNFILTNDSSNEDLKILELNTVKFLRYNLNIEPEKFISSSEIKEFISEKIVSDREFSSIIATLRDSELLISACDKGYKIAINEEDCIQFVENFNNTINPMLNRISTCRKTLLKATMGELDILDTPKFYRLKNSLDKKWPISTSEKDKVEQINLYI